MYIFANTFAFQIYHFANWNQTWQEWSFTEEKFEDDKEVIKSLKSKEMQKTRFSTMNRTENRVNLCAVEG